MHILLVDDHTLFREALLHVLNQLSEKVIVLEAANIDEAQLLLLRFRNLDLVLLDIDLPNTNGLTALPHLRELAPTVPVVVLSGSESTSHVHRALELGAVGYIPKSCSSHEVLNALRMILQGDIFVPARLLGKLGINDDFAASAEPLKQESHEQFLLTARQTEVLELMAKGLPNKSIARSLQLTEGTVKLHVASIMRAMNARNRTEAVITASRLGFVKTPT